MMDTKACGIRVEQYLDRRSLSRGLDKEFIHGFDSGEPTEAVLLASDLRAVIKEHAALLARVAELTEACDIAIKLQNDAQSDAERAERRVAELEARTAAVPEGWALVPVEPTEAMLAAKPKPVGIQAQSCQSMQRNDYRNKYAAMIAAAPDAPAQPVLEPDPRVSRADLEAIDAAMQHMGDALNKIDGCEDDDEEVTAPGFKAIARLLDGGPIAQPVLETPTLPKFVVEKVERLIHEALNPKGMHTNGPCYVHVEVSHLQRLLRAALATPTAQPVATITPALRRALKEWGRAPEGDEDADAALLEAMGAQPVLATEWVDVSERLPDDLTHVLVVVQPERENASRYQTVAVHFTKSDPFICHGWNDLAADPLDGVTHWCPLPPPPASHITGASQ